MATILTSAPRTTVLEAEAQPTRKQSALRRYRLADLTQLPRENGYRYEIFAGELIMTPAPNRLHSVMAGRLIHLIDAALREQHTGWYLMAQPINLEHETADSTIHCEPDLCIFDQPAATVVADSALMPVIVIEIVSPGNPENDYVRKVDAYAVLGIPEYWIVDPANRAVTYLELDVTANPPRYRQAQRSVRVRNLNLDPATLLAGL
jgi:Uma2 family endonuclease